MSRPDRSKKLQNRRTTNESTVTLSFRSLIKNDIPEYIKKQICQEVEKRVNQFSFKNHNAYLALNLLVRECFEQHSELPCFWDQTFLRQLHLGTHGAQKPCIEITKLYQENPYILPNNDRSLGDRNIYSSGAILMSTNIKNHLVTNFERILKKYIYMVNNCTDDQGAVVMSKIYGWKSNRVLKLDDTTKVNLLVLELQALLQLEDSDHLGEQWFKIEANLYTILKFFVHVNIWILDAFKQFDILPMSGMNLKSINLDTSSMEGVFKSIGIDDFEWNKYFDMERIRVEKKTFTGTITTNGIVANVHFLSPKTEKSKTPIKIEGKRVVSNDPGRTNIYYMAEETMPEIFKFYSLTRKSYYQESGINKANKNSSNWNKKVKKELELLSKESKKSLDVSIFKSYLNIVMKTRNDLFTEYSKKKWRQQQFRLYGGKKRVFAKFFNQIGIDDNTVFAYGAAKFSPGGKGEMVVPTAKAYKECAYRAPVIMVDEFRTSKAYWKTWEILKTIAIKTKTGNLKTVRGLLWCSSTKYGFVNRDKNAAINILRCAILSNRPTILDRSLAKEKITQTLGKIIKNKNLSYTTKR